MAEIIRTEWLELCHHMPYASFKAQKIDKVYNKEKAMIELVKYGSKVFTKIDPNDKSKKADRRVYLVAHDNIIAAMKGLRVFDRFGFNLPKQEKTRHGSRVVKGVKVYDFKLENFAWLNILTDEFLVDYIPDFDVNDLRENKIDIDLE